ncbi:MAG: hypothetical protein ABL921_28655 [Pirellula sp.]
MKGRPTKLSIKRDRFGTGISRYILEQRLRLWTTEGNHSTLPVLHPIDDQITGNTPQPATKRPSFLRQFPVRDPPADGDEKLLHQLPSVRVLQAALPQMAIDDGLVNLDKLHPSFMILRITKSK